METRSILLLVRGETGAVLAMRSQVGRGWMKESGLQVMGILSCGGTWSGVHVRTGTEGGVSEGQGGTE